MIGFLSSLTLLEGLSEDFIASLAELAAEVGRVWVCQCV
jgi:hypothetical protein